MARAVYALAVVACLPLAALHAVKLLASLDLAAALPALSGLALGVLAADLVTGGVHWACDTWGDERTRFVGDGLIRSFREHHRDPRAMLAHDWVDVNGQPAVAATAALALMSVPALHTRLAEGAFVYAFLWSLACVAASANQLHQWAHAPHPPAWVRHLQRSGWILSPERHARHHRPPYTVAYCITSGWLNGPLDRLGFWRALERGVGRLAGARPRRRSPGR